MLNKSCLKGLCHLESVFLEHPEFLFGFGLIWGPQPVLLMAYSCPGITPGSARETILGDGDKTGVGDIQGKRLTPILASSLAQLYEFLTLNILRMHTLSKKLRILSHLLTSSNKPHPISIKSY